MVRPVYVAIGSVYLILETIIFSICVTHAYTPMCHLFILVDYEKFRNQVGSLQRLCTHNHWTYFPFFFLPEQFGFWFNYDTYSFQSALNSRKLIELTIVPSVCASSAASFPFGLMVWCCPLNDQTANKKKSHTKNKFHDAFAGVLILWLAVAMWQTFKHIGRR